MSGVSHALADGIQFLQDRHEWCFVSRRSGGQILLSRWMCDLHVHVVAMTTSWSGGYRGALHTNDIYLSMHHMPCNIVGLGIKPK